MSEDKRIAISTTDRLGKEVIAYQGTLDRHRQKHPEPFSNEDIADCLKAPHMIANTGHDELAHKARLVYYKNKDWNDGGPDKMKVIVEHCESPGVLTSAFRTSKVTKDGTIVYLDKSYYGGKLQ